MRRIARSIRCLECRGLRANGGNAAIEFALLAPALIVLLLNTIDVSSLIQARMQLDNAAEMGAQAAYNTCSPGAMPATSNCSSLTSVVTTAVHSTSLGAAVRLAGGSPSEAYYCTTAGDRLQSVGSPPSSRPSSCAAVGQQYAAQTPGDYITVTVRYRFTPTFPGLSVLSSQTMTGIGIQRLL